MRGRTTMATLYKVKKGDTLTSIAKEHGTTVTVLAVLNNIANIHMIREGQFLELPTKKVNSEAIVDHLETALHDIEKLESVRILMELMGR